MEEGGVWMHKQCPEHGFQRALVYADADGYRQLPRFHRKATLPRAFTTEAKGCPDSCGFCPEHEQHVCLPIVEITDHCNWECPICIVRNPAQRHLSLAQVDSILDGLLRTEEQIDVLNLSGGEPTLHPSFREIVDACVARKEILRVSVSTNGSVLARDPSLVRFLADRSVITSLQFDGLDDAIYQALRGRALLDEKRRIIGLCGEFGAPMSLTATVVRGVNLERLSDIAGLLFANDHILSAMFQPAAYAGAAQTLGRPMGAVTIPDVIKHLDGAASGIVSSCDFSPLPCSHPACFSLAFYLRTEGDHFIPIKQLVDAGRHLDLIQNRALFGTDAASFETVTEAVYELWSGPAALSPDSQKALKAVRRLLDGLSASGGFSPRKALSVAERAVKSIFIHQFMDPETFDLSRARKCCQVYPQPDGRHIPACIHNCLKRTAP